MATSFISFIQLEVCDSQLAKQDRWETVDRGLYVGLVGYFDKLDHILLNICLFSDMVESNEDF